MKNTFQAVLSVVLFLIPAFSLFSQTVETGPRVPQTVADDYKDKGGLVYSKETQGPNAAGEYTIFLKTFVTGTVSTQEAHIPSEFVLVLDVSGSMAYVMGADRSPRGNEKSRLQILKEALSEFIDMVKEDATANNVDNKIAIVKYAGDSYYPDETSLAEGDHSYTQRIPGYNDVPNANYSEVVRQFKSVSTGSEDLKSAINGLHAAGSTASDYGIRKAQLLINTLFNGSDAKERTNKIVVFFTDGEPNHATGFDQTVANATISTSNTLKNLTAYVNPSNNQPVPVRVYTVGAFNSKPGNTTEIGRYMQRVSSNYTEATTIYNGSGNNNGGYYFVASSADELKAAFATIQQDQSSASIDLGSSATAVDVVSQSFDIPYVVDSEGNINTDVKVWTAPLSNIATGSDNKPVYTFPITALQPAEGVTLEVDPLTGTVSVTGFDYTLNACAMVNGRPVGNQLIIEIPIKMDDDAVGGHGVATNGPGSGIRYKEKQSDGSYVDKTIEFDTPDISLPTNLEIKKEGLQVGESARFRIQRRLVDSTGAWEDYSTVFVTNKKTNTGFSKDGTVKIIGLHPDYVYRIIEEEGWSWSYGGTTVTGLKYDPETGERTTVTDMTNGTAANNWNDNTVTSDKVNLNPITFTNKKKDVQVRHAESIVINDFKGATSEAQAGHTENSKEQPE